MEQGQQRLRITLARPDSGVSWGFRLQGGADFTTPLSIQLVNPGSIAERYGLHPGDAVLQINGENADYMEHEQAKRHIVAGGNNVEFIVERGGVRIWKPKVTPMSELRPGELQTHGLPNEPAPVQRTSLAHHELQGPSNIGVAHNRSARPFGGSNLNQPPAGYKPGVVHSQFNTPIGLYSADNIADTFVSQTSAMSELRGQPVDVGVSDYQGQTVPGMRSVRAPQTRAPSAATQQTGDVCPMCGMLVTGVFVKVRGKSLHADCFRCEECRKSLKNQGYFWINDRMYCEEHAKQLTQPPDPDLVAVPIYR